MKYRIGHYEYSEDRKDNPYLFTVIGTPDLKAEWEQYRGETRETMTLAEIEAKGIELPDAVGAGIAKAAKDVDAMRGERDEARAMATDAARKYAALKDAIVALVSE